MAPTLRRLALGLPKMIVSTAADKLAETGGRLSPEVARALPDSKGGEEPKDLQRWRTDMYELFTTTLGESVLFYSAEQWIRVQFLLETAGPVAVGTRAEILPVLSGKGRLLTTNIPYEVYLPKGGRLYYAAESVNRVAVTFEPIPWQEQLAMEIRRVAGGIVGAGKEIVGAILQGKPKPPPELPPVPKGVNRIQRLTPMGKPGKML